MPKLKLDGFIVKANIGCPPEEREVAQELEFAFEIDFLSPPLACKTDKLADTVCYHTICDEIKQIAGAGSYLTLEFLTAKIIARLAPFIPSGATLTLTTKKVAPPIPDLKGSSYFQMDLKKE